MVFKFISELKVSGRASQFCVAAVYDRREYRGPQTTVIDRRYRYRIVVVDEGV